MLKKLSKKTLIILFSAIAIFIIGGISLFTILYLHSNKPNQSDSSYSITINANNMELLLGETSKLEVSTNLPNCKLTFILENLEIANIIDDTITAKKCGKTKLTILASNNNSHSSKTIYITVTQSYELVLQTFENCYLQNDTLFYTDNAQFSFLLKNNINDLIAIDEVNIISNNIDFTVLFATISLNGYSDGNLTFIYPEIDFIYNLKLVFYK